MVLALAGAAPVLWADGMLILEPPKRHPDRWDLHAESSQDALIEYAAGMEKLLLRVAAPSPGARKALWLVPVPAAPDKVALDMVRDMPRLEGEEVCRKARMVLEDAVDGLRRLQVHLLLRRFLGWTHVFFLGMSLGELAEEGARPGGIAVHAHLEKEGLVSELITAKSPQGLAAYLKSKGLGGAPPGLPALARYIGRDYSFIVSWVAPSGPAARNLALSATFPAERAYYPLELTGAYGEAVIPTTIRVRGLVLPRLPRELERLAKTDYFADGGSGYTRVQLSAPARLFTQDLWFDPGAPLGVRYRMFFIQRPWAAFWMLGVLGSALAGALAGWLVFREKRDRRGLAWTAALGLANCLSSAGLWIAVLLARTRSDASGSCWWAARLDGRKLLYVPAFGVLYLAALELCEKLLAPLP